MAILAPFDIDPRAHAGSPVRVAALALARVSASFALGSNPPRSRPGAKLEQAACR